MNISKIKTLAITFLIPLLATFPEIADATSVLKPVEGDKAIEMIIKPLFGELSGYGGSDPFESILGVFNSIALLIGGILVAYTLVAGTMSSANDGEVLGKRWSSMWVPIRTALGAAAIFPINGGYCFLQKIVLWLAMMGIGAADAIWLKYASPENLGQITYNAPVQKNKIKLVLRDMLVYNTCVESMSLTQKAIALATNAADPLNVASLAEINNTSSGVGPLVYGPMGSCGTISMPETAVKDNQSAGSGQQSGVFSKIFNASAINEKINPVHNKMMASANEKIKPLAAKIAVGGYDDAEMAKEIETSFNSIANDWNSQVGEAAASAAEQIQSESGDFIKGISQDGFLFAGAWFVEISKRQDAVSAAVNNLPRAKDGAIQREQDPESWTSMLDSWMPFSTAEVKANMQKSWMLSGTATNSNATSVSIYAAENKSPDFTEELLSFFINEDSELFSSGSLGGFNSSASNGVGAQPNPVIMAGSLGNSMVNTGLGLLAAGTLLSTQLWGFGNPYIGEAFMVFAGPLLVTGSALAYYLPMVPLILWIGAIFGWIVILVEAIVAAPIWGVSWLSPDADGVVGKGGQGYMLVLSLTLRPPLMVIGLIFSIGLMSVVGYIVNEAFVATFLSSTPQSLIGIVAAIAGCIIYTVFMVSIINRVFSLIHLIPDNVLRWIGGGGNELGREANATENYTTAKALGGIAASQSISQGASSAAARYSSDRNQRKANEDAGVLNSGTQAVGNAQDNVHQSAKEMKSAENDLIQNPGSRAAAERYEEALSHSASSGLGAAVAEAKLAKARGGTRAATAEDKSNANAAESWLQGVNQMTSSGMSPKDIVDTLARGSSGKTPWEKQVDKTSRQINSSKDFADDIINYRAKGGEDARTDQRAPEE